MQIELDIFSGRPNPRWEIAPEEAREFRTKLAELSESGPLRPLTDMLGYRGLIVRRLSDEPEDFDGLVIYNEVVAARRGDISTTFVDKGRSLEKWLLSTGKPFLEPSLYQEILSVIREGQWVSLSIGVGQASLEVQKITEFMENLEQLPAQNFTLGTNAPALSKSGPAARREVFALNDLLARRPLTTEIG